MNKKILESLIISGACDSLNVKRAQLYKIVDKALKFGQNFKNNENQNQASLFSNDDNNVIIEPQIPQIDEWEKNDLLAREKEVLGFYLTGDPVADYKDDIKELSRLKMNDNIVRTGGIIVNKKLLYDKKNQPWAIIELSNQISKVEIFIFAKEYEKYSNLLEKDKLIFVIGKPSTKNNDNDVIKIISSNIYPLEVARDSVTKSINVIFDENQSKKSLSTIQEIIKDYKGKYPFVIHFKYDQNQYEKIRSRDFLVSNQQTMLLKLRNILGDKNVWIN